MNGAGCRRSACGCCRSRAIACSTPRAIACSTPRAVAAAAMRHDGFSVVALRQQQPEER
jgi:hypothetical protein